MSDLGIYNVKRKFVEVEPISLQILSESNYVNKQ
jgi:hypothetical protein